MIIYPAIDILDGKCVRLTQGRYSDSKVYGEKPYEMAELWESKGAEYLHTVDLNGAREGRPLNIPAISEIVKAVNIPVQTGGGVRTLKDIEALLNIGVSRVILGTSAVRDKGLVKAAVNEYGEKIAVGIDAYGGKVAISGWEEISDLTAHSFARTIAEIGVKNIIYTDISTDGTLKGPNVDAMTEMAAAVPVNVIASGGIGCADDVRSLIPSGVGGVIIGKALYEGKLSLEEVIC